LPPELLLQQQGLTRQQEMAKMLLAQGAQQNAGPAGQMVSGHYVPNSFFQNLQGPVNQMLGAYMGNKADEKSLALAQEIRKGKNATEEEIINNLTPQPAQLTELAGPYAGKVPQPVAYKPASEPNYAGALKTIRTNLYGAGKEYLPQVLKNFIPEDPTSVQEFKYAEKNPLYGIYQREQANLKAPKNVFNMTDIMGKDIGQVKDILVAGQNQVQAGELSINAANKIDQALKSGNLNVGPTANVGQYIGQLGNSLGFVNQKGQEKLVNTRQALQGLAQMWASSRQQAKGQGTMTEGESQLYGKISSGDLDKISMPELQYMVQSTKEQGNYYRKEYENKLNVLRKNPKFADIVPLYEVGSMPTVQWNSGGSSPVVNEALGIVRGNQGGGTR
jgi:hypothetical protein